MFVRRRSLSRADDAMELSGPARVGAELRAARERLGWSLEQVAASLRIRQSYLKALEEGRVAALPGLTYAVGFLRAYAKLLGLDPDALSRRLREEAGEEQTPELEFPAPPPERGVPAGVVVLLGAVLAVGAYIGWYRVSGERPAPPPVQAAPDRLVAMADPASVHSSRPGGKPDQASSPGAATEGHSPSAQSGSEATASIPPSSAAAAVPPAPAAIGPGGPGLPNGAPGRTATGASGSNGAPGAPPPNADNARFMLRARTDSWVQIRDRQGQVLLNRVMRAGETWPIPSQPPGQQLLLTTGNAGGTELLLDGVASPPLGLPGAVKRDLPLDPGLVRDAKLQPPVATAAKAPRSQPAQQ